MWSARLDRTIEEDAIKIVVPGRLELRRLVRDLIGDECGGAGEPVAIRWYPGGALEGVAEEERERPAVPAVADVFLGLLIVGRGRPRRRRCH